MSRISKWKGQQEFEQNELSRRQKSEKKYTASDAARAKKLSGPVKVYSEEERRKLFAVYNARHAGKMMPGDECLAPAMAAEREAKEVLAKRHR